MRASSASWIWKVNDTLGHPVGDKVLKEFASILTEAFSKKAFVGRIGGDEFVVFFKEKVSRSELSEMLGDLIRTVKSTFQAEYPDKNLSSSIGAAMGLGEYADLYRTADSALYEVKKAGKGTYYIVE